MRFTTTACAVIAATAVIAVGSAPASATHSRSLQPASAPNGFAGYFDAVAGVPHSSDVFGVAEDERSGSGGEAIVRRHHGKWHVLKHGDFSSVASAGSHATWAGGSRQASYVEPVIDHWNGKRFVAQHVPATSGLVEDLAASSSSNAWACGDISTDSGEVAEHWNGHHWSAVPVAGEDQFKSIATSSPSSALMVEADNNDSGYAVLRWNGKVWATSFTAPPGVELESVALSSAHDGVVVGVHTSQTNGRNHTFVEHFDGSKWTHVATPNVLHTAGLYSAAAHGKSVWAVGSGNHGNGGYGTLVLHSDNGGKSWKSQHSPIGGDTDFGSVSAVSKKLAYIGGAHRSSDEDDPTTYFAIYNGHRWKSASSAL